MRRELGFALHAPAIHVLETPIQETPLPLFFGWMGDAWVLRGAEWRGG